MGMALRMLFLQLSKRTTIMLHLKSALSEAFSQSLPRKISGRPGR